MVTLPNPCFVALAAIGWADGTMAPEEGASLLRAAQAHGLTDDELHALKEQMTKPVELADIDRLSLTPWQRLLTYALAAWLTQVDGVVTPDEQRMLDRLGVALDLPFSIRVRAEKAALAAAHGDTQAERYDFKALAQTLRDRLPHLAPATS